MAQDRQNRQYEERIAGILREMGVPASYGEETGMPLYAEAEDLVSIGADIYGREQRLTREAAGCWEAMRGAAEVEGVCLLVVSAFRGVDYQCGIWARKLAAGESVEAILRVSAPPGYSEHHTGRAVDVTAPGCAPVTEAFEATPAFAWLVERAGAFGFSMTYPRGNRYGVNYEPWHWSVGVSGSGG